MQVIIYTFGFPVVAMGEQHPCKSHYDYLLRDIAKKHAGTLAHLGVALPPAVTAAPALGGNNHKFRPLIAHINQHGKVLIWGSRF